MAVRHADRRARPDGLQQPLPERVELADADRNALSVADSNADSVTNDGRRPDRGFESR